MTESGNNPNKARGIAMAITAAIVWGFLPIALKVAVADLNAITISWFRFATGFLLLFIIFRLKEPAQLRILLKPPPLLVVGGLALGLNYVLFLIGVDMTTPANAQIIIQLAPIGLALVGMVALKERISPRQAIGFALALVGFGVFYYNQLKSSLGEESVYTGGTLMIILAAAVWVGYGVIQKTMVKSYPPHQLNLVIFGVPALALSPMVDFNGLWHATTTSWMLLVFMGLNSIAAYSCLSEAFKHLDVSKVGIIVAVNPIITLGVMAILSYYKVTWIAPENISVSGLVGAGLVLVGAILAVKSSSGKTSGVSRRLNLKKSLT